MDSFQLALLIILFFVTSIIGVVTGSNSLITVPAMFHFGIEPKIAVATNMFGLTFMSIGASIPFVRGKMIDYRKILPLILVTLVSSTIGAVIVILLKPQSLKLLVSIAMITVAFFVLFENKNENNLSQKLPLSRKWFTILLTFLLGIYGGIYSGGYVTLLTFIYATFSGMNFSESVATTKVINVFSSLVATLVFIWQDLVDYKLGIILALTMFTGAYIGALITTKLLNEKLLRHIFVIVVIMLAVKTLIDAI